MPLVWSNRVRQSQRKHAFEEALDEARLTPDEDLESFVEAAFSSSASHPAVGSVGDIAVAAGYVAPASLARAYGDESQDESDPPEALRVELPAEAVLKLKEALAARVHTPQELKAMRRHFAARNHPDRVDPKLKHEAVAAMAEANAAIDAALKKA